MDWREIGSEVYEYLKGKELEKEKEVAELETRKPSPEMEVSAAIIRATQGDIEWLIELCYPIQSLQFPPKTRGSGSRESSRTGRAENLSADAEPTQKFNSFAVKQ